MMDDGSLKSLGIKPNPNSRSMIGDIVNQSDIVNTKFWVFKYLDNIPTKFSKLNNASGPTLVQIRDSKDSPESSSKKFFTGSEDIKYTLHEIDKLNAFPREVTLKSSKNRFWFE